MELLFYDPIRQFNTVKAFLMDNYLAVPLQEIANGPVVIGYTSATLDCGDCTRRGVNKKPAFWQ
ncbi:MAG: hypothetical protein EOO89_22275 [Pedobacter sp.]|nr:MAG: hypothetical protein EOO89_22275 [Pedobacter sp.]